jgi:hypothetical protein
MERDAVVDALIEALRADRSLIGDSAALRRLLDGYPEHEPSDLAARAREIWKEEMGSAGNLDRAMGAAIVANAVYGAVGDEENGLRAGYDFLQSRYMLADDPDAYESVRAQLGRVYARASGLGLTDLAFRTATLAADCTYFAGTGMEEPARRAAVMDVLLADLLTTCHALRLCPACRTEVPLDFERFVSLVAAGYEVFERALSDLSTAGLWLPDDAAAQEFTARMRRLAAAVEELVPADFSYERFGDAEKSAETAGTLSRLSREYGSREGARSRLRASVGDG